MEYALPVVVGEERMAAMGGEREGERHEMGGIGVGDLKFMGKCF